MPERIGVYVCHCGTNIARTVDVNEVTKFASDLDEVAVARDYEFMCSDPGQDMIKEDVERKNLTKVVVAACSPTLHEDTFMEVVESVGLNRFQFQMSNIREHCSWVTADKDRATEKTIHLINAAVNRVKRHEFLETRKVDVEPRTLVIGGGIAGIEAALGVADSGKEVYLVDKEPSIGGHMAQLDKTFPTLDCSSCILTPKMTNVANHPNINLLTCSEVESIEGFPGNFQVKIRKGARGVDEEECTACDECSKVCPIMAPDEFNELLDVRKAIYIPFPQAVPDAYAIDWDNCIECGVCVEACKEEGPDCIDLKDEDETIDKTFGNIIVATGYDLFDPSVLRRYHYGDYKDVHTALEIERMVDPTGPTQGKVLLSNGSEPKSVIIIHCVGSRDQNFNEYCSEVCCMYSIKLAHLIKDETDADVYEIYMDIRSSGKESEEFYNRIQEEGVIFVRGKAGSIDVEEEEGQLSVNCEDVFLGERIALSADMVVLSPALQPRADADEIAKVFSLSRSEDRFFMERHLKLAPVSTTRQGIFLAGACQGPKDIPDSVAQGAAAANKVVASIDLGFFELDPYVSTINKDVCTGCRTCISVCPFDAIDFDEEKGVSVIEETLCQGCGICSMVCRTGASRQLGYADEQISAEIVGALEGT